MYIDTAQKQGEKYLMPVTECLDVTGLLVLENTKSQETKSKSYSIRFMYMHISNRYILEKLGQVMNLNFIILPTQSKKNQYYQCHESFSKFRRKKIDQAYWFSEVISFKGRKSI